MDLDALEEKLKLIPKDLPTRLAPYKAMAYIMTAFQNPSGVSYSPGNCVLYLTFVTKEKWSNGNTAVALSFIEILCGVL